MDPSKFSRYTVPWGIIGCTSIQHDCLLPPSHDFMHANTRLSGYRLAIASYACINNNHYSVIDFSQKLFIEDGSPPNSPAMSYHY